MIKLSVVTVIVVVVVELHPLSLIRPHKTKTSKETGSVTDTVKVQIQ